MEIIQLWTFWTFFWTFYLNQKLDAFTALPEPSWHCLAPILSLENQERKYVWMCACTHLVMALFEMHSAFSKDTDTKYLIY